MPMTLCPDCQRRQISSFEEKCSTCQARASVRMLALALLTMLGAGALGAWIALLN